MTTALGIEKCKRRCDHCGALYEVTVSRFAERHSSSHACEVCGTVTDWQSIFVPTEFKLIQRPDET